MKLHFAKPTNLSQLHDAILTACPAVCPIDGQAQMIVEGDENNVWLTLPDDLSVEMRQQIEAIVTTHTPKSATQPNWVQFRAQIVTQPAYFRLVTGHPQNSVLNTLLVQLLFGVGENPALLAEVAQIWNAMEGNVPLTALEITQLNAIAVACAVPLRLNASGGMEID